MLWGEKEEALKNAAREGGFPIPPTIAQAPRLPTSLLFYYEAFWELSTTRSVGFAIGPISWVSMDAYARRYEITNSIDFDIFTQLMFAMDRMYFKVKEILKPKPSTDK